MKIKAQTRTIKHNMFSFRIYTQEQFTEEHRRVISSFLFAL